jgi:aspartate kinase
MPIPRTAGEMPIPRTAGEMPVPRTTGEMPVPYSAGEMRDEQGYPDPLDTDPHEQGTHASGGRMRVVAKFGGTSLGTGERIERAADTVASAIEEGHEVAVVASAMGSTTDDLLSDITFETEDADRAEIVSMGERTSVRMLKAALASRGVDAMFLEPGSELWPVITDPHGELDVEKTREAAQALAAVMDGVVPVITGFLAETTDGEVTTLGRGGSDTTAVMLGKYMDADEVVIVTDVEGVMTGDPTVVEGARNVGEITVDELRNLSFRGAEVVAPSALAYKDDRMDVRVTHYQHGDLLRGGTRIEGEFQNLVDMREEPLACMTVAGRAIRNSPGILQRLSTALGENDINVDAVASGMDSITYYVDQSQAQEAEAVLHDEVVSQEPLSSVTVSDDVAVIRITGGQLPNQPGVLSDIVNPLADARINIRDLITSATSIAVFVDWEDREETLEIVQQQF